MRLLALASLLLLGACAHRGAPERGATSPSPTAAAPAASGEAAAPARGSGSDPLDHASVLRSRMPGIVLCYETLLKEDAELAGTFLTTLDLAADGALLGVELTAEDQDPTRLEQCVRAGLEGARFPPAEEGYLIEVPLTFTPRLVDPDPQPEPGGESAAPSTD